MEPGNYEVADSIDYNAKGGFIAPGFIDLHTHGAGGSDFMDCTEEDCLTIAREHLKHGTTLLYPTTLASDNQELLRFLDVYDRIKGKASEQHLEVYTWKDLILPMHSGEHKTLAIYAIRLPKNIWRYWTGVRTLFAGALHLNCPAP